MRYSHHIHKSGWLGRTNRPAFVARSMVALLACLGLCRKAIGEEGPGYRWVNVTTKAAFAPRDGAGALTFGGRMWLLGGWNPRDRIHFPATCTNDVWSSKNGLIWTLEKPNTFGTPGFDPARDWEGRHTAGYVVFKDKMWIVGGDAIQKHYQDDVWNSGDGKTWHHVNKGKPVPWGPRVLHYTLAFKDRIWVIGGQTTPQFGPADERFYDDMWNSSDGITWTRVIPEPPYWPQRGMIGGSVVFKDRMWILGGGTYDTPKIPQRKFYNDAWSSPDGVHWTRHLEAAPWAPRQYHDVAVWDDKMWVMEGYNASSGNRKDVWYSSDGVTWREIPNTPWKPRHAASVFVYNDALWMVAGNNMESDVWRLQRTSSAAIAANASAVGKSPPVSRTVTEVLREPLPSEDLSCSAEAARIIIQGPAFRYTVDRTSGAIVGLEATRRGEVVAALREPVDLRIDDLRLVTGTGTTEVLTQGKDKVILAGEGRLAPDIAYALRSTFYNDGVVVAEFKLRPKKDLMIRRGITCQVGAIGRFSHYLHKRRDTNGTDCFKGALPEAGKPVGLATLTSCLEVFSPEAALAVFTDRGGIHRSPADIETASLRVGEKKGDRASLVLTQHIVHIGPGGAAYTVRSGEEFTFRVGLAVAPNRLPHPRWRDLRMFIWVGDQKYPYPTDEEILTAARLGFTLFQMHRLGTPGEPRPPAGELDRVLKTVHDAGMLFIWTANADLMYAGAKGVVDLQTAGKWSLWQGFNYGGRYKAKMDPYCDTVATCLASPNGLADYRIQCKTRMLEKYPIDGMYIDDNLPYANCTLWKEHAHPQKVYDCLIELHEMNWRRRQALLSKCPHAVLIDHCSMGIILPTMSAFDCHLFGEGYSFPSIEAYWSTYGSFQNMPAQGCLYAGDTETARCAAEIAYAFDLLTGGGQYCYLDWRLWPKKFPYASGVKPSEVFFVKTYNLAQYYFGMYESEPCYFARSKDVFTTTAPNTYATVYCNHTWNESLAVLANMGKAAVKTSLVFHQPEKLSLAADRRYAIYDVSLRTVATVPGSEMPRRFVDLPLAPYQLKLLHIREVPEGALYHQWGGKRISETWDAPARKLSLRLHGPAGLEDLILLGSGGNGIEQVTVNGKSAEFSTDPAGKIIHGKVTFGREPIVLEVTCSQDGRCRLPSRPLTADELTTEYYANQRPTP